MGNLQWAILDMHIYNVPAGKKALNIIQGPLANYLIG
jgi:hypothetical protein